MISSYGSHEWPGSYLVIEGVGGVGKNTQKDLLRIWLEKMGVRVGEISFPRYEVLPYGPIIERYKNNQLGDANAVHPILAGLPYALDRQGAKAELEKMLSENTVVLGSRGIASNLAYQGAKLEGVEREAYIQEQLALEFEYLGFIREDALIFLDAPVELAMELAEQRAAKTGSTNEGRDGHEQDMVQVEKIAQVYRDLVDQLAYGHRIYCANEAGTALLSVEEIQEKLQQVVSEFL